MRGNARRRVHARRQRVSDDLGSLACGDLEKIMAEILDSGVRLSSVSERGKASGYIHVSAGGSGRRGHENREEEDGKKMCT
jgi:hypothetical protein